MGYRDRMSPHVGTGLAEKPQLFDAPTPDLEILVPQLCDVFRTRSQAILVSVGELPAPRLMVAGRELESDDLPRRQPHTVQYPYCPGYEIMRTRWP